MLGWRMAQVADDESTKGAATVPVYFRVSKGIRKKLRHLAADEDTTINQLLLRIVVAHLEKRA